jgi:phage terminase large subunit GpA-like protein
MMMTSWNSIADAKSFSWDLILMDELDEAGYELKGQGDPEALFAVRGVTARNLKIFKISTPTNTQGRIYRNFLEGDQRYYNCRCPLCGELQVLRMMTEGRDYGLTFQSERIEKVDQVIPESVHYICEKCKGQIQEYQKQDLLAGGQWIPTARPVNPAYRSYHISNLMSPIMFYTWTRVCQDWTETGYGQNITKLKAFIINILGEPWESRAEKKSWEELRARAEDYIKGVIPAGGLLLTAGADVQKNRIELQVVAWGVDMESWVIDYQYFYGETGQRTARVWTDFQTFIQTKKYPLKNIEIPITLTAIDTGYNPDEDRDAGTNTTTEHIVYEVVARNAARVIACRGNAKLKDMILKEERVKRQSPLKRRYDVAVNELKDETFVKVDLPRGSSGEIHFPKDAGEEYFKGFVSEVFAEIEPGKWGYRKVFDRNEPLDTYILNRAAAERLNLTLWTPELWASYEDKIFRR